MKKQTLDPLARLTKMAVKSAERIEKAILTNDSNFDFDREKSIHSEIRAQLRKNRK